MYCLMRKERFQSPSSKLTTGVKLLYASSDMPQVKPTFPSLLYRPALQVLTYFCHRTLPG